MSENDDNVYSDFTIRIRFRLTGKNYLNISEAEVVIGKFKEYGDVLLKSVDNNTSIKDAEWLAVKVSNIPCNEIAENMAVELEDALSRTFAFLNLGADYGRRVPGGGFFNTFLNQMSEKTGKTVLNDQVGVMIYPTQLNPVVARVGEISLSLSVKSDRLADIFQLAIDDAKLMSVRERIAFDLFTMAHKVSDSADARFVLLFAAVETLLEPIDRPESSIKHVEELIDITKGADLPNNEKQSLLGTLSWLKTHSIRSSGKMYVKKMLGSRDYGGLEATKFFIKCYDLRNRLLHGSEPHADWREVSNIAAPLEVMVSHLLSCELQNKKRDNA